ncbi:MAG: hypothetical protein DRP83_01365 [Planctomycetota bacterium]|nr:MAG: hypothetical protein DRP83_01365 [Planctomycetota bacterium]
MTPFEKGAEDVLDVLGVKPGMVTNIKEKVVEHVPESVKKLKKELGQSYRPTPYNVLFGRYKDTLGGMAKGVKEKLQDLID